MNRAILVWLVLIGLLQNQPSLAQEFQEAPGRILSLGKAGLLGLENVRSDLGLTEEQALAVRKIVNAQNAMKSDLQGLIKTVWPEDRPAKAAEVSKRLAAYSEEVAKKLQNVLDAPQLARLEEIYTQARGLQALYDPKVVEKLGLSEAQKERLANARKKQTDAFNSWAKSEPELSPQGSKERQAWADERRAFRKEFDDAVLSSLTAEQVEQFRKLRGKPIDLSNESALRGQRGGRAFGQRRGMP